MPLFLQYAAISDVGRVRKDNQDSGYAGPWLLTVCDGVGGAARGDVASATAVSMLRRLDAPPGDGDDLLGRVAGALHRAHDRIAELVEEDSSLGGTSTTATVVLFDGTRLGVGHVGDSRAYLLREGRLQQITRDHTFVQTLIDEGRITEEESRTHPHRHLILKALDGVQDPEPDLFEVELEAGDVVLVCSDGASGVLTDGRLADICSSGTPDYAAVELVRASLEAGSNDNVTAVVARVIEAEPEPPLEPLLVGAAAELPRRAGRGVGAGMGALFRGHRAGDTGEIEPVTDDDAPRSAPREAKVDPEVYRYAPRPPRRFGWLRRLLGAAVVLGLVWIGLAYAWSWSQRQYFVSDSDGVVTIFRGLNTDLPGISLNSPYETTDVSLDRLPAIDAEQITEGIEAQSLEDARTTVDNFARQQQMEAGDTGGSTAG